MEKCEDCKQYKRDVFYRPDAGRRQCGQCNYEFLRGASQTGLVQVPGYLRRKAK